MNNTEDPNYGDKIYIDSSLISNCCGSPKRDDSDICLKCGEHAAFENVSNERNSKISRKSRRIY